MASLDLVWAQLKSAGAASLDEVRADGFTRTLAGDGLARVNPFYTGVDVEGGAPYSLDEWSGYLQNAFPTQGSALLVEPGYGEFTATWVRPAGYTRALSIVSQRLYFNNMGSSEDLNVNPFDGSFVDVGDVTSYVRTTATPGNYYAVGVKQIWDDSDEIFVCPDSGAYAPHGSATPLIGAGVGVSTGEIWALAPEIHSISQSPDRSDCFAGEDVTISISWTMQGTSEGTLQESLNNGASWTTIDSSVAAGSSGYNLTRQSGHSYKYRIRYNDVSPIVWDETINFSAVCDLI